MIEIAAIKTADGYYYTDNIQNKSWHNTALYNKKINGETPTKSFKDGWFFSKELPKIITSISSVEHINKRFELIDPSLASDKIAHVLNAVDVLEYINDIHDWIDEYAHLRSLYTYRYDTKPAEIIEHEFTIDILMEYDGSVYEEGFSYEVQKTRFRSEGMWNITAKDAQNQLLDTIIFPAPLLPTKPCRLTSHQSYKIIREHIKKNIDDRAARITSDYEFCFAVSKRVALIDEYEVRREIMKSNGKSYKKPRYNTKLVKTHEVPVFEMTHAGENYRGYTPIPAFEGANHEDLKNNIDTYLDELIIYINTPMKECPCCKGIGAIIDE